MIADTLTYNGTEKSFRDWGFSLDSVRGEKVPNGMDTFQATVVNTTVSAEADAPTFPFEAQIVVWVNRTLTGSTWSGGTVKFIGKRTLQPLAASANGHGVTYQFEGPWYDLMNTDYLQLFLGANGISYYLPEVVLNTSTAVTAGQIQISVGDQIQAILQWLLDQYAAQSMLPPFQYAGRTLNSGAIDLNVGAGAGTPGGNYSFTGRLYTYQLATTPTIDPSLFSLFLPTLIQKPSKCGQVLLKCVEFSPRINIWFDYSTTLAGNPCPTIHFDWVDSMPPMTLPLFSGPAASGPSHKALNITARYDLQVRSVVIRFRITNTISGVSQVDYAVDKWSGNGTQYGKPGASNVNLNGAGNNVTDPNAGLRVVTELLDLQGFSTNTLKGYLDLELINSIGTSQAAKRAWWAGKRGGEVAKLEDYRVRFHDKNNAATTIPDMQLYYATAGVDSTGAAVAANQEFTAADYAYYQYRVVAGTYHDWMKQGGTQINTVKCKGAAKMTWTEYEVPGTSDSDLTGKKTGGRNQSEQHCNLILTNAAPDSGTSGYANFEILASSTPGEAYITGGGGIAQYLYLHLNTLQFDGEYVMVEANFDDSTSATYVTPGKSLNFSGGAALWTAMNAQIQRITEDYGRHQTGVKIGVSKILNAGQLSDLFKMWRNRRTWYNPALRSNNTISASGTVDMAKSTGNANTTQGIQNDVSAVLTDYSTLPTGSTPGVVNSSVIADATHITQNAGLNA
jgi:hypothetical protein